MRNRHWIPSSWSSISQIDAIYWWMYKIIFMQFERQNFMFSYKTLIWFSSHYHNFWVPADFGGIGLNRQRAKSISSRFKWNISQIPLVDTQRIWQQSINWKIDFLWGGGKDSSNDFLFQEFFIKGKIPLLTSSREVFFPLKT